MRPTPGSMYELNHIAPSGPAVICRNSPATDGTLKKAILPFVVMRPMPKRSAKSLNHNAPSGPSAIPDGSPYSNPVGNSVYFPLVVRRPIALASRSVNHSALSGPTQIHVGPEPTLYAVTF